ncbi:MAG: hypothetical protein U9R42_10105 [Bacteroidota bacterium]|nr:hypothetical protein [Bacteroidota bacterium]
MKSKFKLLLIILSTIFLIQGCTISKFSGNNEIPLSFSQAGEEYVLIKHIKIKKVLNFQYKSSFDVNNLIKKEITKHEADAVNNINVELKFTATNFFLDAISLGIAYSRTIIIEADLMKKKENLF